MSLEEAQRFYLETTRMSERAARAEVTKNSMFPGAAVIYFVGAKLIHELRRELTPGLELRAFHDAFLSHGSIPVSLIRREMLSGSGGQGRKRAEVSGSGRRPASNFPNRR